MRFFFFGTLIDDEVLALVVGRSVPAFDKRPASLPGYRRVKADGVTYPIIVAQENAKVSGLLVSGISRAEADRLIAYEGSSYELASRRVECGNVSRCALVFVPVASGGLKPTDDDWKYEEWVDLHRAGFVARLRRWKTAESAD